MPKAKKLCSWDNVVAKGHTLFTQGNVNEVLPGVTRPLYADLASWWDYYWCDGVAKDLGVSDLVNVAPPPHFNQLAFMGGRWTVNVSFNLELSKTWTVDGENAMLQSFFEGGDAIVATGSSDTDRAAAANAIITKRWNDTVALRGKVDRLSRNSYAATRKLKVHALSDARLIALIDANTRLMGETFVFHYYVTVGGGEFASRLGKLLDRYFKRRPAEWVTTLTSGLGDVESARPGKAIWDLGRLVAARPSLRNELALAPTETTLARLAAPPGDDWRAFSESYRRFTAEFGWRGQRESDPSTPSWDEAPTFVLGAILAAADAPASADPYRRERRATNARERLEAKVLARVPRSEKAAFRKQLKLTQVLAREREAVKATWARESRNFRPLVLELGRRFMERKLIDGREDVWFLRWDEVKKAVTGVLTARVAKNAIAARKAEYESLKDFMMPDGVFAWPADLVEIGGNIDSSVTTFQALGVSPGVAEGPARVILDAYGDADIEPGEILVAPVTDAPWTPLFIPAAAVVVEMGGVLSHAATVAREFGIPGVSGVKDATRMIRTGQLVRVDGNTGTVTLLSR